jgi:putative sterol carrier protein
MNVTESFTAMVESFSPSAAGNMKKTLQWNITGEETGKYAVKVENGICELITGGVEKPDITFTIADKDWLQVTEGTLDPMKAFTSGKLKMAGNMMLAMKIPQLFPARR